MSLHQSASSLGAQGACTMLLCTHVLLLLYREVLCTDKTGTLTEDRVTLLQHLDARGAACPEVLCLALANSHFQVGGP